MKADIHPHYAEHTATCSCGITFTFKSTVNRDLNLEVCSNCHPFYTGKAKQAETGGRLDKFKRRYGNKEAGKAA